MKRSKGARIRGRRRRRRGSIWKQKPRNLRRRGSTTRRRERDATTNVGSGNGSHTHAKPHRVMTHHLSLAKRSASKRARLAIRERHPSARRSECAPLAEKLIGGERVVLVLNSC